MPTKHALLSGPSCLLLVFLSSSRRPPAVFPSSQALSHEMNTGEAGHAARMLDDKAGGGTGLVATDGSGSLPSGGYPWACGGWCKQTVCRMRPCQVSDA